MSVGDVNYEPLCIDDECHEYPTKFEDYCLYVPIIGWLIGSHLEYRRENQIRMKIIRQLLSRSEFPEEEWGRHAPQVPVTRVHRYCDAIRKVCEWPNSNFSPADPTRLLVVGSEPIEVPNEIFGGNSDRIQLFNNIVDMRQVVCSDLSVFIKLLYKVEILDMPHR